ncbi:MAG: MGMT family protein [Terriglobales bacterium]
MPPGTGPAAAFTSAATDKGICAIQFADSEQQLQQGLMREFPFAVRRRDDSALAQWKTSLTRLIEGQDANASLPLDIRATAFQRRVWEALQGIPRGETRSYGRSPAIASSAKMEPWVAIAGASEEKNDCLPWKNTSNWE